MSIPKSGTVRGISGVSRRVLSSMLYPQIPGNLCALPRQGNGMASLPLRDFPYEPYPRIPESRRTL